MGSPKDFVTREHILKKFRSLFPESSFLVAQVGALGGNTYFHIALQLPNPPKKRALYFRIHGAFPDLVEDQLQMDGITGWGRLRNRIIREDPKHISWGKDDTPRKEGVVPFSPSKSPHDRAAEGERPNAVERCEG